MTLRDTRLVAYMQFLRVILVALVASVVARLWVAPGGLPTAATDWFPAVAAGPLRPGGADSVAIIAASSNVDVPFVMALQMARFILVLLVGPTLAKAVARWTKS